MEFGFCIFFSFHTSFFSNVQLYTHLCKLHVCLSRHHMVSMWCDATFTFSLGMCQCWTRANNSPYDQIKTLDILCIAYGTCGTLLLFSSHNLKERIEEKESVCVCIRVWRKKPMSRTWHIYFILLVWQVHKFTFFLSKGWQYTHLHTQTHWICLAEARKWNVEETMRSFTSTSIAIAVHAVAWKMFLFPLICLLASSFTYLLILVRLGCLSIYIIQMHKLAFTLLILWKYSVIFFNHVNRFAEFDFEFEKPIHITGI